MRAQACLTAPADVTLEAERLAEDDPLLVIPLEALATGDPACPYRAAGLAEFWMALVDVPLDCVRASLLSTGGVVATRAACFSDL